MLASLPKNQWKKWLGAWMVMLVLLAAGTVEAARFSTVIIDPGHGGHDRGGVPGQKIPEKTVALDVSLRLERVLRAAGYKTILTRKNDTFISLADRVKMANRYRDAIFVSVHFNSASRTGAAGIETFYYNSASRGLASSIQNNLMRAVRTENRGVKHRGFYVIRNTRMPAVLVECGFLTNPKEARLASNARHRQLLAEQIGRGVIQFGGGRGNFRGGGSSPSTYTVKRYAEPDKRSTPSVTVRGSGGALRSETPEERAARIRREYLAIMEKRQQEVQSQRR